MENNFSGADPPEFDVGGDRRDELFDVLSDSRRRVMLHFLQAAEMPISMNELITALVAWETRQSVSDHSGADRDAIEISLVHNHLPKMAETGFIRYDGARQTVTHAGRTDEVRAHLQQRTSD